jgi:hypothetical protein
MARAGRVLLGELVDRPMESGETGNQLRLDLLELGDIKQARPRRAAWLSGQRDECGMSCFELAEGTLEGGDLSTQLQPSRCLGVSDRTSTCGRDVERGGDSARVHAGVLSFASGVGRDGIDGRGCLHGRVADEGARALAADEDPLVLEPLVDGANGVGVDVQGEGEVAQTR